MKFRLETQSVVLIAVLGLTPALPGFTQSAPKAPDAKTVPLREGWEIQSGCEATGGRSQAILRGVPPEGLDQGNGPNDRACSPGGSRNLS